MCIRDSANSESPEFFGEASALLSKWDGQTIEDAQKMKVDGVTAVSYTHLDVYKRQDRERYGTESERGQDAGLQDAAGRHALLDGAALSGQIGRAHV